MRAGWRVGDGFAGDAAGRSVLCGRLRLESRVSDFTYPDLASRPGLVFLSRRRRRTKPRLEARTSECGLKSYIPNNAGKSQTVPPQRTVQTPTPTKKQIAPTMHAHITLLPGDGIGPEVVAQGRLLLEAIAARYGHSFSMEEALIGGCAINASGDPLPAATIAACLRADAVLLGAVGGPQWSDPNAPVRPEQGLLTLRATLGVFANLRPVKPHPVGAKQSPIKAHLLKNVDLIFVRELTGGSYFGAKQKTAEMATDECRYTVTEIERVTRRAAELARARRGKLTHVDKANVMETSRLWRSTVTRLMREEYPEVRVEHLLVDAMAMYLLTRPADFDVILTENLFGDILTDEAAVLAGSMGLLPSASLGTGKVGLFEPIHGSAPDIAGKGIANPYATMLSVAMLLRHSFGLEVEANAVEAAVSQALDDGVLTRDLRKRASVSTAEAGSAVIARLPQRQRRAA